jgi:hypothetical protein
MAHREAERSQEEQQFNFLALQVIHIVFPLHLEQYACFTDSSEIGGYFFVDISYKIG